MAEFKRLTTGEVASKRFTPVRMREGYSMDEVDEFLESVEKTIESYDDTVADLQQDLTTARNAPPPVAVDTGELDRAKAETAAAKKELVESQQQLSALQETLQLMGNQLIEARAEAEKNAALASTASAQAAANAAAVPEMIPSGPMDIVGATTTITRMLESAAKSHDDLVAQGEAEALRIRDSAQEEADILLQEAEAQVKRKLLDAESSSNASFAGLEGRKRDLEDAVERLRVIEHTSREALVKQYSSSLEEIKAIPLIVDAAPAAVPAAGAHTFDSTPSFSQ